MYFEASVAVTEKTNQPNKLPNKKKKSKPKFQDYRSTRAPFTPANHEVVVQIRWVSIASVFVVYKNCTFRSADDDEQPAYSNRNLYSKLEALSIYGTLISD